MYGVPEAKIILDSISPDGVRLTTMEVKMHRFVLAEFNTHRVKSRNSASSRAIPIKKMISRVLEDPALPVFWGKNQAGMQASVELNEQEKVIAAEKWLRGRDQSVQLVRELQDEVDLHKQLANRLLETWMWQTVIVTATNWDNFFTQRCHKDAQPEMRAAAMAMQKAYYEGLKASRFHLNPYYEYFGPMRLDFNEWHLPYVTSSSTLGDIWDYCKKQTSGNNLRIKSDVLEISKKVSVARCARVSYLTHDGEMNIEKDLDLFEKLKLADVMHASPFEHVATPMFPTEPQKGNFRGWKQFRHEFANESTEKFIINHPDLV